MYLLYMQKTETVSSGFAKKRKQNAIVYFMCNDFSKYKNYKDHCGCGSKNHVFL